MFRTSESEVQRKNISCFRSLAAAAAKHFPSHRHSLTCSGHDMEDGRVRRSLECILQSLADFNTLMRGVVNFVTLTSEKEAKSEDKPVF